MQSFLQLVAHDLYTKIGNDLSRTVLVFPNKRANLFFNEYLAGESDKPIWSPAAMSISDLFQKLSVQKSGDPIRLVCELYKVFKEETRSQETLDDFYFWGELLISDFDDVDKNMVDADKLFSNLQDLKNLMDDYEFLDKEQEEAIQQFFQNFSIEKRTELKEKFISLWDKLSSIYHRYQVNGPCGDRLRQLLSRLNRRVHGHLIAAAAVERYRGHFAADKAPHPRTRVDQSAPPGFGVTAGRRGVVNRQQGRQIAQRRQAVAGLKLSAVDAIGNDIGNQQVGRARRMLLLMGFPPARR